MDREQLDRLLAEYATGGLSEEDRKKLFAAALEDQELFDQLMEEDAIREAIELPGARNRLIDSLQEETSRFAEPMVHAKMIGRRVPERPRRSNWLAWAAGIAIVFVSGAISYILMQPEPYFQVVRAPRSRSGSSPARTAPMPGAVVRHDSGPIEAPPKVMAEARAPQSLPSANIPLPSTPPPELDQRQAPAEQSRQVQIQSQELAKREEAAPAAVQSQTQGQMIAMADKAKDRDQQQSRFRQQQAPPPSAAAPAAVQSRRADASANELGKAAGAGGFAQEAAKEKKTITVPSIWRQSAAGAWVRIPEGEAAGRNDSIRIRYTLTGTSAALADEEGRTLERKGGRAGEEIEFTVPAATLRSAGAAQLTLTVTEASQPPVKIILRLR